MEYTITIFSLLRLLFFVTIVLLFMQKIFIKHRKFFHLAIFYLVFGLLVTIIISQQTFFTFQSKATTAEKNTLTQNLTTAEKNYQKLLNADQYKRNEALQKESTDLQSTYAKSVTVYEQLTELKLKTKTDKLDQLYALLVKQLADKNYASAQASLTLLGKNIQTEQDKLAAQATSGSSGAASANVTASNTPPGSGYSRQRVKTDIGEFVVDIIAADLNSTRVIVDTATDGDCKDNCAVLPLGDYVARNGAFAGINGTYFCPAAYPTCAGKTNSFDLLVMNKNKKYINADNNVYSTNPAVIFQGGSVRFVGQALEWGRDTSVDGVISNYPLLLSGGNITFGGDGDPKKGGKGSRSFVAAKGSTVYIGVVQNATVAEAAHALKGLGMEHAMNLDSGGSTALWSGGYKAGPGRNIPNAILFVRK